MALVKATGAERNTPASAGRTRLGPLLPGRPAEHPRVGGEDDLLQRDGWVRNGTPPRRRGGLRQLHRSETVHRNTPASAGRTRTGAGRRTGRAEHPRVGGEDATAPHVSLTVVGTPPRRRGGPMATSTLRHSARNTPASAGRTAPTARHRCCWPEHPRVGGEDVMDMTSGVISDGTPPRRRGGRRRHQQTPVDRRNTPASAGRTGTAGPGVLDVVEHPRVGGEDPPGAAPELRLIRNTPASAGRTSGW